MAYKRDGFRCLGRELKSYSFTFKLLCCGTVAIQNILISLHQSFKFEAGFGLIKSNIIAPDDESALLLNGWAIGTMLFATRMHYKHLK